MKLIFVLSWLLAGCSVDNFPDANVFAEQREVTCFSGGKQVYHGIAKGKVEISPGGTLEFQQADTGHYIMAHGTCFVELTVGK